MLSSKPGTYVLVLELWHPERVAVGRLGCFKFKAGWYAYVGSALGPGGLAARLHRHLRSDKVQHWHIDYLREKALPAEIWYAVGLQRRECTWAQTLARLPDAEVLVPRLGSTDCSCSSHLIYFTESPSPGALTKASDIPISRMTLDYK